MKQFHPFSLERNSNALFWSLFGKLSINIYNIPMGHPIFSGVKVWHAIELYHNQVQVKGVYQE